VDHQFAASSTARFLSALRRFYQYLNREKLRSDDPTVLLEGPKLPKKLPSDLSEAEVEALLQAPWWTIRWSCGTRQCSSCSTPPGCGCPSWWG
jgi:site-specific recombinase XerD